jgi:hypothetical protein
MRTEGRTNLIFVFVQFMQRLQKQFKNSWNYNWNMQQGNNHRIITFKSKEHLYFQSGPFDNWGNRVYGNKLAEGACT